MFGRKTRTFTGLAGRKMMAFVGTADAARAKAFYAGTLGLRLIGEDAFALVFDVGGTRLRISVVPDVHPAGYTVLGWTVPDIREAVRELSNRGIHFERYERMRQDADGIWDAPSGARVAWFTDPDGNTLSITQYPGPSR